MSSYVLIAVIESTMNGIGGGEHRRRREGVVEGVRGEQAGARLEEIANRRGVARLHRDDLSGDEQVPLALEVLGGAVVRGDAQVLERLRGLQHAGAAVEVHRTEVGGEVRDLLALPSAAAKKSRCTTSWSRTSVSSRSSDALIPE